MLLNKGKGSHSCKKNSLKMKFWIPITWKYKSRSNHQLLILSNIKMQQTSLESIWAVLKYLTNAIVVPRDCYLSPNLPPALSQQQVIFLKWA